MHSVYFCLLLLCSFVGILYGETQPLKELSRPIRSPHIHKPFLGGLFGSGPPGGGYNNKPPTVVNNNYVTNVNNYAHGGHGYDGGYGHGGGSYAGSAAIAGGGHGHGQSQAGAFAFGPLSGAFAQAFGGR